MGAQEVRNTPVINVQGSQKDCKEKEKKIGGGAGSLGEGQKIVII